MATFKSTQRTNATAEPRVINSPRDSHGRKRVMVWNFTTPAGMAINDLVELGILPIGARVLGGRVNHGAMGASATVDIGIAGSEAKYAAAVAVAAAGDFDYANTIALNSLSVTTVEELVLAKDEGAAWASAQAFHGQMEYVLD